MQGLCCQERVFYLDYRTPAAVVVVTCFIFPSSGYELFHPAMACTVNFVDKVELRVGTTQINRNKTITFVARIGHAIIKMPNEWAFGTSRPCSVSRLDQMYYQKKSEIPVLSM